MNKICAVLVLFVVSLCITSPVYAGSPAMTKKMTYWQNGAVTKALPKATRVEAQYCVASAFHVIGEPSTETPPLIYLAVPAGCVASSSLGVAFYGAFENIELVGISEGVGYFKAIPSPEEPFGVPSVGSIFTGDDVFVYDETPIEIVLGDESISAYPGQDTILPGVVIGTASGERRASNCNPSGCRTESESLYGFRVVDRGWSVPPGTAVLNGTNQFVGVVIGADKGRTVFLEWSSLMNGLYNLGIIENGKG